MFALQCLSCEHDNPVGAKFCVECGSPLNLKLCKHCEAINEAAAQRCHNCGTEFPVHAAEARGAQGGGSRLAGGRLRRTTAALSAVLLAAIAGLAYSLYRQPTAGPSAIHSAPAVPSGAAADDRSTAEAATSAPPVSRSQPPVTHTTRGVAAPNAPRPAVKQATAVTSGAAAPDAASADSTTSALPVSRLHPPVTHTKGAVAAPIAPIPKVRQEAAVTAGATMEPQAPAQPPASESRVNARQDQPSSGNCTEVVAALGLCISKAKGEGN